jgi:hypothetical protein
MTRRVQALGSGAAALLAALALTAGASAQADPVSVTVDRTRITASLGGDFSFRTTIANAAASETKSLVAHLNILSLREGTYVDPEDWSTRRTLYLGTIPAHGSRTITWRLSAVGSGSLAAYVSVLPQANPSEPPATSPPIQIAVAERRMLNSGGILPLALGVPAFVGLLTGGVRLARRRR